MKRGEVERAEKKDENHAYESHLDERLKLEHFCTFARIYTAFLSLRALEAKSIRRLMLSVICL
jgi:hypothetical protein